jgi:outer membrane protein assembly factor BamB
MSMKKFLPILALCSIAGLAVADGWPKWRGPAGDGISHETGLLDKWPADGPKKLWSEDVGLGFSSPIGDDGKVYLLSQKDSQETLQAFDAKTGKIVWSQGSTGGYPKDDFPGSRATPTIDGKYIYTYGGGGDLICRELDGGKEVWHDNILQLTHTSLLTWGQASSPLVSEKLTYVQCGLGGPVVVAVDNADGKIVWQSEAQGKGGYAAPILMTISGSPQLVVFGGEALIGMDPMTGKTLWSNPWQTNYDVNASTPVVDGDKVFISSGYSHGAAQFQVTPTGAKQVWFSPDVQSRFPAAVLDGGYLYCVSEDRSGTLKCLDWKTGKVKWVAKGGRAMKFGFGGSFVRDGDMLYAMSQSGLLSLIKATPEGAELISQAQVFDADFSKVWSTPLIYHGKLYAKGQSQLICLDISDKAGAAQ